MTLMATYPANPQILPPCSIIRASLENVENVVKPPQRPTVRNNAQLLPSVPFLLKTPHRRPIRKQPTRLTVSVAHGNPFPMPFIIRPTRYLADPPMKLPAPTANTFFIISDTILICLAGTNILLFSVPNVFVLQRFCNAESLALADGGGTFVANKMI